MLKKQLFYLIGIVLSGLSVITHAYGLLENNSAADWTIKREDGDKINGGKGNMYLYNRVGIEICAMRKPSDSCVLPTDSRYIIKPTTRGHKSKYSLIDHTGKAAGTVKYYYHLNWVIAVDLTLVTTPWWNSNHLIILADSVLGEYPQSLWPNEGMNYGVSFEPGVIGSDDITWHQDNACIKRSFANDKKIAEAGLINYTHASLWLNTDGNLVLWGTDARSGHWLWESGTHNNPNTDRVCYQEDGNLVIYDRYDNAIWAANVSSDKIVLQDNCNLVLYKDGKAVWESGTHLHESCWMNPIF